VDLDLTLNVDELPISTELNNAQEKTDYKQWKRSNHLSLMLIKSRISKSIKGFIIQCSREKDFLKAIKKQFAHS
jgi:hypothetical protein